VLGEFAECPFCCDGVPVHMSGLGLSEGRRISTGEVNGNFFCTIDRMITVTPLPPKTTWKLAGQASANARVSGRSTGLTPLDPASEEGCG